MNRRLAWTILFFPILFSFYGDKSDAPREDIKKLYREAERLYSFENSTDSTYNLSLNYFCELINKLENDPDRHDYDSLLFHAYLKKGILLDVVKTKYSEASQSYCRAINIQQTTGKQISDSLLFMAYNYAGACYYNMNNFDSASLFLLKAQQLIEKFPAMPEKERLYNTLGVLYYDNGNYIQSKNYFNQALDILHAEQPLEHNASVSIETNIATSLYRLGLYKEAIAKYEGILKYHVYGNYIYMNMGRANAALNKYQEAMNCFRKVKALELPGVYNEMAFSTMQLNHLDSAAYYLDALKHSRSNKLSLLDIGVNELYKSDLLNRQGQQASALKGLQQSIGIFSGHFNDSSIASNPSDFTGTYTYSWLFEALFRKATTLQSLYAVNHEEAYLLNAFNTYKTTLTLLAYIEKSYDTDDAKLFLKKKSWQVYRQALELSLALNQLHPGDKYLEEAFLISEKNKASIVAANLQEKTISLEAGSEAHWMQEERNIKYNIARLNVNSDQSQDSRTIEANAREKSRYEIELAELQKKNERDHRYHKIKYQDNYPSIPELQQRLYYKQAMISFYISGKILHAFILTQNEFKYVKIDSFQAIQTAVDNWLTHLRTAEPGRKFSPGQTGNFLHQHLIRPLQEQLAGKDEWIIIPDGILYYLPFESLPADQENRFLLETTAISYQFSSRFVEKGGSNSIFDTSPGKVLAFAPFVHTKPLPGQPFEGQLPASADEVAGLRGNRYMDSSATKARFLQEMNKYPIVHLATHAVSDVHNASASFIAFYPQKKIMSEDCLFLEELYGLNMDATQLMIISACETGKGELVNNEGVISIARAFTYAGCASVINSLWKTDDRATSAILKQFHVYLQHGFSKSRALQQAKLDFIKGNAIYRSPEYWSPLILIGNAEPLYPSDHTHRWAILLAGSIGFVIVAVANWRRRKNKK